MTQTSGVKGLEHATSPQRENLITILQDMQANFHYLPEAKLREVADRLRVPLIQVFHVATFYSCFSLEPVGKHLVHVCLGTACHVRGAPRVLDRLLQELRLSQPGTTKDCEFTVKTVRCVGCCALAPVVRVDADTHHHLTQAKVRGLLRRYHREAPVPAAA